MLYQRMTTFIIKQLRRLRTAARGRQERAASAFSYVGRFLQRPAPSFLEIYDPELMRQIMERFCGADYELIGLIYAGTGRFSILRTPDTAVFSPHKCQDYQSCLPYICGTAAAESENAQMRQKLQLSSVTAALKRTAVYTLSYLVQEKNNRIRRKRWQYAFVNDDRRIIAVAKSDITDICLTEFDPISGVYNRLKFRAEARKLIDSMPCKQFLIVRFDLDHFKIFNDLYGMDGGNRVLSQIGERLRTLRPASAVFGRVEADHFVCCLPEEELGLLPSAAALSAWLGEHNPDFDFVLRAGIYRIEDRSLDIDLMSDRAYLALSSIKGACDRQTAYYDESMRSALLAEQEIAGEMRAALEHNEFSIELQPQYDHTTGVIVGAEALARWFHPKKGKLTPGAFISIFERNGFIAQLDRYIWEVSCRLLRQWLDRNISVVPLSVNVSRADLYDPCICDTLSGLVERYRLEPRLLRLEITETEYMKNPAQLIGVLRELRARGFFVEMDDFGSSYSSLNALKNTPVDMLKLDLRFLSAEGEDENRGGIILDSVVQMARRLCLPVMAEGVETEQQAAFLKSIGCALVQGYLYAKPMAPEDFALLLMNPAK